eukprot:CAMPEP_0116147016 /NCGR_PEP_ID=MMETSP0329-20121206/17511_1 /TAXON_ID=697910 /ORGANISM="Pseudo-nitzschia arenysensis, Strain B593" /LENGTH=319 /DNA_ID=CAMNT_0003642879 /DNA_START=290 /DNA_END=1249 /DNA_ORIENTATION=+
MSETATNDQIATYQNSEPATMEEGIAAAANTEAAVDDEPDNNKSGCYKKLLVGLVLLGFIIFVIVDTQTNNYVRTGIVAFLEWIENNTVAGVFCFVAVYFIATIFFVPGSILTLGAGFVFSAALDSLGWGVLLGTAAVWVGASLGAIAAFLLGRYLFRDSIALKLNEKYPVFHAIDNAFVDKGLRIMVLMRLSPIVPFNVLNYAAGVTGVQFWHYVIACIAMLPGTILYVFVGASAGSLTEIGGDDEDEEEGMNRAVTITVVVCGVVFGFLAIAVTGWYAKKEFDKIVAEKEPEGSAEMSEDNEENNNNNNNNNTTIEA